MRSQDDTIAALATPVGESGISVIRISGSGAVALADKCFKCKNPLRNAKTQTAHFGRIYRGKGILIDDAIATVFREPHSYTGEDVVEISCHGNLFIVNLILGEVTRLGARLAEPGEFTKRAFLNGRIDLSQAEAVADLIRSKTELSHRASIAQLHGALSSQISELRNRLIQFCALLELELDFVEEGLEFVRRDAMITKLNDITGRIKNLLETYSTGKIIREGVKVVFIGEPNVGKSSIFNYLVNENRAIVTAVPGTTRDVLIENISINGVMFVLADTAGIRDTDNIVEIEGIKKTNSEIKKADIIVLVLDAAKWADKRGKYFEGLEKELGEEKQNSVILLNKADLVKKGIKISEKILNKYKILKTSAVTGEGIPLLKKVLYQNATRNDLLNNVKSGTVINARHRDCLMKAEERIDAARRSLKENMSNEFIAMDIRLALKHLGEVMGTVVSEDILNDIFSRFCVGK